MVQLFNYKNTFQLSNGKSIDDLTMAYTIIGNLTPTAKIVWVFHALTANSNPADWWKGMVNENGLFNTNEYCIICANIPGSCYGSTGPLTIKLTTNEPYFYDFPVFSIADVVNCFALLKNHLQITKINIGIGASMGGQHLLHWAATEPLLFENIIPIACNAKQTNFTLAIDVVQRLAIENDSTWGKKNENAGSNGMQVARAIALLHYRTKADLLLKNNEKGTIETYLKHQAKKIAYRFNAFSYYFLSLSRNTHNVEGLLHLITAKTLIIGFISDELYLIEEQQYLTKNIKNAQIAELNSIYGHDAFLVETELLTKTIKDFLSNAK